MAMKLKFVDKVEIRGERFCAAYFPERKTIEIGRILPWWSKLECLLHEAPHVINDLFLGGWTYLDFVWDVVDNLIYHNFEGIAKSHKYYFEPKKKG